MILAWNWKFRKVTSHLRESGRLNLLFAMALRCNMRLRFWAKMATLCADTGFYNESMTAAKKWLLEHQAIVLVPYELREGEEKKLPRRQHVYQLTGYIYIEGEYYPTLLINNPEVWDSIQESLLAILRHSENSVGEYSGAEDSESGTKDILKLLKDVSQQVAFAPEDEDGDADASPPPSPLNGGSDLTLFKENHAHAHTPAHTHARETTRENTWNGFVQVLGEICGIDVAIAKNRGKVQKFASDLWNVGYTVQDLKVFAVKVVANDWRWGKRKDGRFEYPRLDEVVEAIGQVKSQLAAVVEEMNRPETREERMDRLEQEYGDLMNLNEKLGLPVQSEIGSLRQQREEFYRRGSDERNEDFNRRWGEFLDNIRQHTHPQRWVKKYGSLRLVGLVGETLILEVDSWEEHKQLLQERSWVGTLSRYMGRDVAFQLFVSE